MLDDIILFIKLYETQSFKLCSELLKIKSSTVSKHIAKLEQALGKTLIIRTSRSFHPTKFGDYIYEKFKHLPDFTQETLNTYDKNHHKNIESGSLNISMGSAISYELICPLLDEFIKLNPNAQLNINFTTNITSWPSENTDIVLATKSIDNNHLENRFLRTEYAHLYCRTEYGLKYGIPLEPTELIKHRVIGALDTNNNPLDYIVLNNQKTNKEFLLDLSNTNLRTNNALHLRKIGLNSDFIFGSWDFLCVRDISNGTLIKVLPEWATFKIDFYLVTRKKITPLQQLFIDFIYHCMGIAYNKLTYPHAPCAGD